MGKKRKKTNKDKKEVKPKLALLPLMTRLSLTAMFVYLPALFFYLGVYSTPGISSTHLGYLGIMAYVQNYEDTLEGLKFKMPIRMTVVTRRETVQQNIFKWQ